MGWVRTLLSGYPAASNGTNVRVQLRHVATGECHVRLIRQEWWIDEDFRHGYEALCAEEGFEIAYAKPQDAARAFAREW
jgi:hypothetical protein